MRALGRRQQGRGRAAHVGCSNEVRDRGILPGSRWALGLRWACPGGVLGSPPGLHCPRLELPPWLPLDAPLGVAGIACPETALIPSGHLGSRCFLGAGWRRGAEHLAPPAHSPLRLAGVLDPVSDPRKFAGSESLVRDGRASVGGKYRACRVAPRTRLTTCCAVGRTFLTLFNNARCGRRPSASGVESWDGEAGVIRRAGSFG